MDHSNGVAVEVSFDNDGEVSMVVRGEIDATTSGPFRDQLFGLLSCDLSTKRVVVDLSGVEFMDASGVSALVAGAREARVRRRELVVTKPSRLVRRILEVVGDSVDIPVEADGPAHAVERSGSSGPTR